MLQASQHAEVLGIGMAASSLRCEDEAKGTRSDCEGRMRESGSERASVLAGMGKLDGFFPVGLSSFLLSLGYATPAASLPRPDDAEGGREAEGRGASKQKMTATTVRPRIERASERGMMSDAFRFRNASGVEDGRTDDLTEEEHA